MRSASTSGVPLALVILAEVGGALLCGLITAFVLAYGIAYVVLALNPDVGMGLLSIQVFVAVIGFGAGAGGGAALAGRLLGQRGSAWLAVGSGAVAGVLIILALRLLNIGGLFGILGAGVPLTLVAAVAAYNLRRAP